MPGSLENKLERVMSEYIALGIPQQIDYDKFHLYSLITHSTAIEGSTVTELENQMLFDEGLSVAGKPIAEVMMNLDLKAAYEEAFKMAERGEDLTVANLCRLSSLVMKNSGSVYNTFSGSFDSSKGELRLVNVTAGYGGRSYMSYLKVPDRIEAFCREFNNRRHGLKSDASLAEKYALSFDAHLMLVTIHPWADGNGRMARLVMNMLQVEQGIIPSKITKEHKQEYINSLVASREEDSFEPFRAFMLAEHIGNLESEMSVFKKSVSEDCGIFRNMTDVDDVPAKRGLKP